MPTLLSHLDTSKPFIIVRHQPHLEKKNDTFVINYIGDAYRFMMDDMVIYFDGKKITQVFDYKKDPALKNNLLGKADIAKSTKPR